MISHNQLFVIVAFTIAVFLTLVSVTGGLVHFAWLKEIELTVAIVAFALLAFNSFWRWRWPFLQGWFVRRPHLWGTWSVTLKSDWKDTNTGQVIAPIGATFSIRQSYTSLYVRMASDQSDGELVSANLVRKEDGGFRLVGTYRNEPNIAARATSPIHYGTFLLDVEGSPNSPSGMRGHYWTDRGTKGEMFAVR